MWLTSTCKVGTFSSRLLEHSNQGLFALFCFSSFSAFFFFGHDKVHFIFYNKCPTYYFITLPCLNKAHRSELNGSNFVLTIRKKQFQRPPLF